MTISTLVGNGVHVKTKFRGWGVLSYIKTTRLTKKVKN